MRPEPRLYEQMAANVAKLIERGALRPGDRMPSVRRLSRQQGVSVATVIPAYLQLSRGRTCWRTRCGRWGGWREVGERGEG